MKKNLTYSEKLRDPRWQKRRLEVLTQAGWACESCGRSDLELQVHHGYYRKKADPWDYGNEYLFCLCFRCHEQAEVERGEVYRIIGMIPPGRVFDLMPAILDHYASLCPDGAAPPEPALPVAPSRQPDPDPGPPASEQEIADFFDQMNEILSEGRSSNA